MRGRVWKHIDHRPNGKRKYQDSIGRLPKVALSFQHLRI